MIDEIDCYNEIIDCFIKSKNDFKQKEICRDRSIIKIMKIWREKKDFYIKEIIKNSLIFVLTLFEDPNDPPDLYNTLGKESSSLKNSEKEEFVSTLKEEFLY
ncbi:MAG: hypothetical protein ACFFDK_07670 [Promethearchaeota archaeon]